MIIDIFGADISLRGALLKDNQSLTLQPGIEFPDADTLQTPIDVYIWSQLDEHRQHGDYDLIHITLQDGSIEKIHVAVDPTNDKIHYPSLVPMHGHFHHATVTLGKLDQPLEATVVENDPNGQPTATTISLTEGVIKSVLLVAPTAQYYTKTPFPQGPGIVIEDKTPKSYLPKIFSLRLGIATQSSEN